MLKLELNGNWELRDGTGEHICKVHVPGTVISGLYNAGKINHPYYRENEYGIRGLFQKDYEFSRSFEVGGALLEEEEVALVCEGLDTLVSIYINENKIASANNMHRTYRFSIKEFLKEGENEIRIAFPSVLQYIGQYQYKENKTVRYVPNGAIKGNHLIRKGHSMFGWDWGPQLVDAGIWRDIYITGSSGARIEDVRIRQDHREDGTVSVKAEIRMSAKPDLPIHVLLTDPDGEKHFAAVKEGNTANIYEAEILIEEPRLWWPNGYGKHPLYHFTVSLGKEQKIEKKIGLRTLTVSQKADQWEKNRVFTEVLCPGQF